jgi:hypothetical protein
MVFANEDFISGLFSYTISYPILNSDGQIVAYGMGSANSQEVKYKYRYEKRENEEKERILNPEPADAQNTLVKMASKRAFVDGVLKATGASRMFTQDVEDMPWLSEEKASSKQIDYIKSLYKGKSEAEILAEINPVIGKEYTDLKEITRNEASAVIEAKKGKKQEQQEKYTCSECGTEIRQAEAVYSKKHFDAELCRACQDKRKQK